jgi:hypothetical protein
VTIRNPATPHHCDGNVVHPQITKTKENIEKSPPFDFAAAEPLQCEFSINRDLTYKPKISPI